MKLGYDTLTILLVCWNVVAFLIMGIDKRKAIKEKRRISESTLLMLAFSFGGPGILMGMLSFRHKTRKAAFLILVPIAVLANLLLVVGAVTLLK